MRKSRALRPRLRSLSFVVVCGLASFAAERSARAEPYDADAKRLATSAINEDYIGGKFPSAQKKLEKAIAGCKGGKCSAKVLARLYRDLGVVFLGGLNKPKQGKKALSQAIQTDPKVKLDPDLTTPEIAKAFKEVGGSTADEEPEEEKIVLEEEPAPADTAKEGDSAARTNWFSLGFQQDLLLHSATNPVCYGPHYTCFNADGSEYSGPIYDGAGNQTSGGIALATTRILLGYERLFDKNILLGGRLGFAFRGAPDSRAGVKFLPLHIELRASYVFGSDPFASDGFRPYAALGFGVAEVDSRVPVEYYEDEAGYTAGLKGTLDAWTRTGKTFAAPTLGAQYAFGTSSALSAELRFGIMLGSYGFAPAAGLTYSHGL